jgi:hypothetical protein
MNNPLGLVDPSGPICNGADGVGMAVGGNPADGTGIFSQEECEANGSTRVDPVYTTDTVTADPLPTQDGFTLYIQDFVNVYANISLTSVSVQLNRCAAPRVNSAYSKAIGNGKIVNAVAGNTFASLSQLALGPGRVEGLIGTAVSGPQPQNAVNVGIQVIGRALGNIPTSKGSFRVATHLAGHKEFFTAQETR